jgi:hypothetical protein
VGEAGIAVRTLLDFVCEDVVDFAGPGERLFRRQDVGTGAGCRQDLHGDAVLVHVGDAVLAEIDQVGLDLGTRRGRIGMRIAAFYDEIRVYPLHQGFYGIVFFQCDNAHNSSFVRMRRIAAQQQRQPTALAKDRVARGL